MQAVESMRKEGLALVELRDRATQSVTEKRTALRKLENLALERKNRCEAAACLISMQTSSKA